MCEAAGRSEEDPKKPEQGQPAHPIELDSFAQVDTPRYVVHDGTGADGGGGDAAGEVPEAPPHLCPYCDYILTGLTSRRCPECGEEFTLAEARRRWSELSEGTLIARRFIRHEKIALWVGLGMIVGGVVAPWFAYTPGFGLWGIVVNPRRGLIMLMLVPVLPASWLMLRVYFDVRWLHIVLATGVFMAVFGVMLALT